MHRFSATFSFIFVLLLVSGCALRPAAEADLVGNYSDLTQNVVTQGDKAIDFTLPDGEGNLVSLSQALNQQHVLLIFYRGDWCPFCIDQFSTIQPVLPELKSHGVALLAVSPDEQNAAMNTQRRFGQDYQFLSDPSLAVTKRYGIASDKALPHPAVYLIRKSSESAGGEVVWMYASTDHKTRPNGEQLLSQVKRLLTRP